MVFISGLLLCGWFPEMPSASLGFLEMMKVVRGDGVNRSVNVGFSSVILGLLLFLAMLVMGLWGE